MAKKVSVEIEVDSSQVDQAVGKLGQIKDLGRGLKIQYDIDGKPLDIVIDKSLNLQKQVKILTAELRRTKEGTDEFKLLSSRLGDTQDQLAKTTAKSKDLFTSLSMIPGPIGQFFSQLQGGIELLKTFSSFTFKDLSFQFKETANDIADIGKNLGDVDSEAIDGIKNSANETSDSVNTLTENVKELGSGLENASGDIAGTAAANKTLTDAITKSAASYSHLNEAQNLVAKQLDILENNFEVETQMMESGIYIRKKGTETYRQLSEAEMMAVQSGTALTVTTEGLVVAEKTATFWTTTLGTTIKTVLISTGILVAIVVLGELVAMLYRFVTSTKDAESATRSLTIALEEQQRVLQNDLDALDMSTKALITRAKIAGKSEQEIFDITKKSGEERLKLLQDFDNQLIADRDKLGKDTKIKEEERAKLSKDINDKILKNGQDITKQILSNEQIRLDEQLKLTEKNRESSKKNQEKITEDTKSANEQLKTLRNDNILASIQDERFKQRSELEFQKQGEENKINALKISEDLKGKIKEQISIKYDLKLKELNKKFGEEDIKASEEFSKKLEQISIDAIQKDIDRQIAVRESKYSNDLRDLEKDKEFIKMSEDAKGAYRAELLAAKEEDIRKIKIDAAIKLYGEELVLLQAQQRNLMEGTDAYYKNQLAVEENVYQTKLKNAEKNRDDVNKIEKEHQENLKTIRLQGFIAEKSLAIQRIGVIKGIGDSLQQLAGDNKDVAIAGILVTKAAGVAEIIMNTQIANAKALATLGPIAGPIWVGINSVAAGLSIAATVKSAIDGINQIKSAGSTASAGGETQAAQPQMANYGKNYEKGGMIGGRRHAEGGTLIEAEKGEAIMTRGAVTMFAPLLSTLNQMGGGTSFAPSLMTTSYDAPVTARPSQDQAPIIVKSYVVSSELTTEQNKQARLKDLSTL